MKLSTKTYGNGPTVYAILPGLSANASFFEPLAERVAARGHTVITLDLRGHGDSPRAESYEISDFAGDVIETLPAGLTGVIGHSLGGLVLGECIAELGAERAIYLDPAWYVPHSFAGVGSRTNIGEHEDRTPFSLSELALANPRWTHETAVAAALCHAQWDSSMYESMMSRVQGRDFIPYPPPVPSLVLFAGASPLYPSAEQIDLLAAGYEVRVQPGASHNLHVDDPGATVKCLTGWI